MTIRRMMLVCIDKDIGGLLTIIDSPNPEWQCYGVHPFCKAYLGLLKYGRPCEIHKVCSGNQHFPSFVVNEVFRISDHYIRVHLNLGLARSKDPHRLCGDQGKSYGLPSANGILLVEKLLEVSACVLR